MAQISSDELAREVEGQTVATAFLRTVAAYGDKVALRWRADDGSWAEWTWSEYAERVARATAGLREAGVAPGDRIVLMLRNVPEFHVLDLAAVFCGATPISIYNSSSPEQIAYLAGHSGAKLGFAEDAGFLDRFVKVRDELPALATLGIIRDPGALASDDLLTWEGLLQHEPIDLAEAASLTTPDALATVIYTSGTTGPPKGVMISHFNVVFTASSLLRALASDDLHTLQMVSYLPMAHIAERITSHYNPLITGAEVTCCPDPRQLSTYLTDVRPTMMFGVPRVWEKIHAGVAAALAADPERAKQFEDGVDAARPIAQARSWGTATEEQNATWDFLQAVAFQQVRELTGLDQVRWAISGAAPIPAELLEWFNAIGVPLSEIYGMSESSGPMTWSPTRIKPGTVGPAIPGCEVKLAEDGEIICRGGNVFVGYLDAPEKTAETLDEDGWLHSGDIGEDDDDGYYRVVDRKKELIITAGGKNISPANLEAALKMIPLVGQACAIGDKRPFVAALLVLDPEMATAWAKRRGIEFGGLSDLAAHDDVTEEVTRGLEEVMAPFNNAERVKKVKILSDEWLPDSEELTPTSKLKRRGIHAKYQDEIEQLYAR